MMAKADLPVICISFLELYRGIMAISRVLIDNMRIEYNLTGKILL
jgi:hypothetical protein